MPSVRHRCEDAEYDDDAEVEDTQVRKTDLTTFQKALFVDGGPPSEEEIEKGRTRILRRKVP